MSSSANTVLVTGAMGQLGKLTTAILLRRGHRVIALDLRNEHTIASARGLTPAPGEPGELLPAFVDLLDAAAVRTLVAEHPPSAIVHLAASVAPPCYRNPVLAHRVNVDGTTNLVDAAKGLPVPPMFVLASSSAVYGPRNPHRFTAPLTGVTPLHPADCYGAQKLAAEETVAGSGLPYAILRLGAIVSPDGLRQLDRDYFILLRASPRDNRVHAVDARDAALAFANAAGLTAEIHGKVLLIAGNESYMFRQWEIQDDMMKVTGVGAIGPDAFLPGDPDDDRGWGLTDWFDTTEAQKLLGFQHHSWTDTQVWVADSLGRRRAAIRAVSPVLRGTIRGLLTVLRRRERRGSYADPWAFIRTKYGTEALAPEALDV
ncbi:oxidoreductase [Parafrankia colletiae]|uniref:Oxidoreductase n=1 Tax=Parafrankia colletiae TaxID=573497 RepID=A0A1S1R8A4_9ACTN|nr:NAD(P)-dependent oxidoreductase [Parafrankia colletiae]MCK9905004.1 NAD(P)-dependent oxidoreductase [Frankia sp. Cpl3]OHV41991.1 oxidoreductase [Parafrankia colletiae]